MSQALPPAANKPKTSPGNSMRSAFLSFRLMLLLVPAIATLWAIQHTGLLLDLKSDHLAMLGLLLVGCVASQVVAWAIWRRALGLEAMSVGAGLFWAAQLIYFVGPGEVVVAAVLVTGALSIGTLALRPESYGVLDRLLLGVAMMVSVVAWLLPFPLHDSRLYIGLFAVLLILRRRQLSIDAKQIGTQVAALGTSHPLLLTFTVTVVGFASMGLWLPSLNYDDNSAHLAIQSQFLRDGYYRLDFASQVWALAPWFNNTWHAVAAMLLGAESRAAVNLIWLLMGVAGAYRLARAVGGTQRAGLLAAAIYASHPLTVYFGTTLQVDGPTTAVLLHLFAVLSRPDLVRRSAWLPGGLIGMALALKMTNVVYLLLPCIYVTWLAFRQRSWRWWLGVVIVALFTGGASYFYATILTGNPTFPMFNTVFQSPYYPLAGFSDPRWHVGISATTLWDLHFDTSRYMEALPGALGISTMVLLGGFLVVAVRRGPARWILLSTLLPAAILFVEIQYARYVFPAIAISCVLATAQLDAVLIRWPRTFSAVVVVLCALNLSLMATTSWIMQKGAWIGMLKHGRAYAEVLERDATPQHPLLDRMINRYPHACVLNVDPGRPFTARMAGRAVSVNWYDPQMQKALKWSDADPEGARWAEILRSVGVSHVAVPKDSNESLTAALRTLGARWEDREGALELWRLDTGSGDNGMCAPRFFEARDTAHRLLHPFDDHTGKVDRAD